MSRRTDLVIGLFLLTGPAVSPATEPRTVQQQVRADGHGEVTVDNVRGLIDVIGWDRPQVAAIAELRGPRLGLDVTPGSGGTAVHISGYDRGWLGLFEWDPVSEAHLTVYVPRHSSVSVGGVSAEVRSSGIQGAQHLSSVSGEVRGDVADADVTAHTVSGAIDLHGGGPLVHVAASSVSGHIDLENGSGALDAHSVSGSLRVTLSAARQIQLRTTSGGITVTAGLTPTATLDAHSISGHVRVDVQSDSGFTYAARSVSGAMRDCFDAPAHGRWHERSEHHHRVWGTMGSGGARIHVKTVSGAVSLCDRAGDSG